MWMRQGRSIAFDTTPIPPRPSGWLQAGLNSFAYRLAHLAVPRPLAVLVAAAIFYVV
jgi:hypothetical protein